MAVKVARGVKSRIREDLGNFVIQVQGAADPDAAARALALAAEDIWNLDGGLASDPTLRPGDRNNPKFVSQALPAGPGPFVIVDGGSTPHRLLATIPEVVARRLGEAGVHEAVIACPQGGGPLTYAYLFDPARRPRFGPAVVLWLFPPPPVRFRQRAHIPDEWLAEASSWVREALDDNDDVRASVGGLEDHDEFEDRLTRRLACAVVADARVMSIQASSGLTAGRPRGPQPAPVMASRHGWKWWRRGRPW